MIENVQKTENSLINVQETKNKYNLRRRFKYHMFGLSFIYIVFFFCYYFAQCFKKATI